MGEGRHMKILIELLQELQDSFAPLHQVNMIITDSLGHPLTSFTVPHSHVSLNEENVGKILNHIQAELSRNSQTKRSMMVEVSYEEEQIHYFIMAPIPIGSTNDYFIWIGPVIPGFSASQLMRKLDKLALLCSYVIEKYIKDEIDKKFFKIAHKLANSEGHKVGVPALLHSFIEHKGIEFVGYAQPAEHHLYFISQIEGDFSTQLLNSTFFAGEGYLGQAVVTGKSMFWNHIEQDTRAQFFYLKGVKLTQLFCYPVVMEGEVRGLIFGGNTTNKAIREDVFRYGEVLKDFITVIEKRELEAKLVTEQLNKFNTLSEYIQLVNDLDDLNKVLYTTIDMAQNTKGHLFSTLFLEHPSQENVIEIYRGMSKEEHRQYAEDVMQRYFDRANRDSKEVAIEQWKMNTVIEIPIYHNNQLVGLLSVGMEESELVEQNLICLKTLVSTFSLALHRFQLKSEGETRNVLTTIAKESDRKKDLRISVNERVEKIENNKNSQKVSKGEAEINEVLSSLPITERELQVLELILKALSNQEIAEKLCISIHTVKNHITNIFQKMAVVDRAQLMAKVYSMMYAQANIEDY